MNIVHNEGKGFYIYDENKEILAKLEYKRNNNVLIFFVDKVWKRC